MEDPTLTLEKSQTLGLSEPGEEFIIYLPKPHQTLWELRQLRQAERRAKFEPEREHVQKMSLNPTKTNGIEFPTCFDPHENQPNN